MTELRDYQAEAVAEFNRDRAAGIKRIMIVAPTASGKTVIGAEVIRQTVAAFHRCAGARASARDHHSD